GAPSRAGNKRGRPRGPPYDWARNGNPDTLRRADVAQEPTDFRTQRIGLLRQLEGGAHHLGRGRAGRGHALADALGIAGDFGGAARGVLRVVGDLALCGALVFYGGGDEVGDFPHLLDGLADPFDGADDLAGGVLNGPDARADFARRLGGLSGQSLDLARDHREAAARLA